MQTKQLDSILRVILAAALAGSALAACGGQVSDGTGQTAGSDGGSGGATAGAGPTTAGSGGVHAGAGGAGAGAGGAGAGGAGAGGAAAGGAAAGAGGSVVAGSGGAGGETGEPFQALSCDAILQGLPQEIGVDSIEIWRGTGAGESVAGWMQVASGGMPCVVPEKSTCGDDRIAAANDPSVTGLRPFSGGAFLPTFERVITTKGGSVARAQDKSSLLAMFGGKLDTEAKLLLWLRYSFAAGVPCEIQVRHVGSHFEVKAQVEVNDCPITTELQTLAVNDDGSIVVLEHGPQSSGGACAGRRPEGLDDPGGCDRAGSDRTGQHFAALAHLEAASVEAFDRLTAELSVLGAPADMLAGCQRARLDETRHTALMTHLAARFGGSVRPVVVAPARLRSAAEIAHENAVEGCVRETFGALVAHFQASQSPDEEVRAALAQIAEDETRHAALSWEIQGWLEQQAGCGGVLARAQAAAVAGLRSEIERGCLDGGEVAGLPDRDTARRLLDGLARHLLA
jgi:hypothetical protein